MDSDLYIESMPSVVHLFVAEFMRMDNDFYLAPHLASPGSFSLSSSLNPLTHIPFQGIVSWEVSRCQPIFMHCTLILVVASDV